MPATQDEIVRLAVRLANGDWHPDINGWPDHFGADDQRTVVTFGLYECRRRRERRDPRQRKAMQLLRSWLPPHAREDLRRSGDRFHLVGSAGGHYRLNPRQGVTERVERHGKNFYRVSTFCYHDPESELPPADVTLAHALLLLTDEPAFLAAANETRHESQMWDGAYLRRCAAWRRDRHHEVAA